MVAGMSRGKKAYLQYEQQLSQAIARLAQLREELKAGIDVDAESYNQVMAAYKSAKTTSGNEMLIDSALRIATQVPLETAQKAREVADIVESLRPITNPNMASDLTVASALAKAAITGGLANVEINLGSLKDAGFADEVRSKVGKLQG
jgi:formiminotetrahydrofolate cyclodeaminase